MKSDHTDPLRETVESAMTRLGTLRRKAGHLFPPNVNLYPAPFFGDVRRAEVLTLALNPSHAEFDEKRHWPSGSDGYALTTRLLHYFDLPDLPAHSWFDPLERGLLYLGCSYETNAAHVDLCAFPTLRPREVGREHVTMLRQACVKDAEHLPAILAQCKRVKLVLVIDYPDVWDTINERSSCLKPYVVGAGVEPPVLRLNYSICSDHLFRHRRRIRDYLQSAQRLSFTENV